MRLFILIVVGTSVCGGSTVTIQTRLGKMMGLSEFNNINGVLYTYNVFKRIPFAKPPIGDLRFEEPVPFGSWEGTLDATMFGPSCIQPPSMPSNFTQSEDCLYLNIYVPVGASASNPKSVMIWIHGGGFIFGEGTMYDGSFLSGIGDVIVVTLNYRLNAFGFLSSADNVIIGNYGLWDQKLAIQWVNDNIDIFGGNAKSITLFGESAGAISVSLHTLHPQNRGLFKRAIMQSGTGNSISANSAISRLTAQQLARELNCSTELTEDALKCFKNKSTQEIHKAYLDLSYTERISFAPVVDGKFLNDTPSNIINNRDSPAFELYKSLDIIIGNDDAEGSLMLGALDVLWNNTVNIKYGIPFDVFCKDIVTPFVENYFNHNTALVYVICNKYSSKDPLQQGRNVVDFYGDVIMYTPAVQCLNTHAIRNYYNTKQYQYLAKRRSYYSPSLEQYPWFQGSGHAAELPYLFPERNRVGDATRDDIQYAVYLMKYWSNFAKTGYV